MNQLLQRLVIGANGRRGILAPVPLANMKLGPEDELSVKVRAFMIDKLLDGSYRGIFFHVPNESGERGRGVSVMRRQMKKKAVGMVPGSSDWVFAWGGGSGVVELKDKKGRLTDNQEDFRDWSEWSGVNHGVARSVVELETLLIGWGALPCVELAEAV